MLAEILFPVLWHLVWTAISDFDYSSMWAQIARLSLEMANAYSQQLRPLDQHLKPLRLSVEFALLPGQLKL